MSQAISSVHTRKQMNFTQHTSAQLATKKYFFCRGGNKIGGGGNTRAAISARGFARSPSLSSENNSMSKYSLPCKKREVKDVSKIRAFFLLLQRFTSCAILISRTLSSQFHELYHVCIKQSVICISHTLSSEYQSLYYLHITNSLSSEHHKLCHLNITNSIITKKLPFQISFGTEPQ